MLPGKSDVPKLDQSKSSPTTTLTSQLTSLTKTQPNCRVVSESTNQQSVQDGIHTDQNGGGQAAPPRGQTQPRMLDTKSYLERMRHYHELGLVDQQGKPKSDRFTPLDLSGQKRKVESPLDLTVKTTRRCADTTQDFDQIMNSDLKTRPLLNGHCDSSQVPRNPRKEKLLAYKQQCCAQQSIAEAPSVQAVVQVEGKAEVPVKLLNAYHTSSRRYLLTADGLKSEPVGRGGLGGSVAVQGGALAVERSFDAHDGGIKIITKPIPKELIQNNNSAFGTYSLMPKDQLMKKPTKVTITRASSPEIQEQFTGFQPIKPAPLRVNTNLPVKPVSNLSPGAPIANGLNGFNVDLIAKKNINSCFLPHSKNNSKDSKSHVPVLMDMTAKSDVNAKRTSVVHSESSEAGKNNVGSRTSTRAESKESRSESKNSSDNRSLKSGDVPTTKKLSVSVKPISTEGIRKAMKTPPKSPKNGAGDKNERKSRNSSPEKRLARRTPERRSSPEKKNKRTPDKPSEKSRDKSMDNKSEGDKISSSRTPEKRQRSPVKRSPADRRRAHEAKAQQAEQAEQAQQAEQAEQARQNGVKSDDAVSSSDERAERSGRNTPNSRGRKRTLLEKLNDGNGFIIDQKRRKASSSLDADPSTLGREERLLRHALLRFDTLDAKSSSPDPTSTDDKERKRKREKPPEVEETTTTTPTPTPPSAKNKVPNNKLSTSSPKRTNTKSTIRKMTRQSVESDDLPPSPKPKKAKRTTNKTKAKPKPSEILNSSDENTDKEDEEKSSSDKRRKTRKVAVIKSDSEDDVDDNSDVRTEHCDVTVENNDVRTEHGGSIECKVDVEEVESEDADGTGRESPDLRPRAKKLRKSNSSRIQRARSDWKRRKVQQAKKWSNKKKVKLRKEVGAGTSRDEEDPGVEDSEDPELMYDDYQGTDGSSRDGTPSKQRNVDMKRLVVNKTSGETALHRAGRLNYEDVALHLLQTGAVDVNARDNAGYTALHECTVKGNIGIAKHLVNFGADINAAAADGTRPIHDAVDNHQLEVVRLLLACGADPMLATYSGRTTFKLARTPKMKQFMTGYLVDLNQSAPEMGDLNDDPLPWEFDGSSAVNVDVGTNLGQDLFEDVPVSDVTENEMEFEFYKDEPPELYRVTLPNEEEIHDVILLNDILERLKLSRQQLMETHPKVCMDIKRMKTCLMQQQCPKLKQSLQNQRSPSQFTEVIPLTVNVKELLNCQTLVVDYFTGETFEDRQDDDELDVKSPASDSTEIYGEMDHEMENDELPSNSPSEKEVLPSNVTNSEAPLPIVVTSNQEPMIDLTRHDTVMNIINEKIDNAVKRDFAQDLSVKAAPVAKPVANDTLSSQPVKPPYNPYLHQPYRTTQEYKHTVNHTPAITTQANRTFTGYNTSQTTASYPAPTTASYPGYTGYSSGYYPYRNNYSSAYDTNRSHGLVDYTSSPYLPVTTQSTPPSYQNRYSVTTTDTGNVNKSSHQYTGYNRPQPSSRPLPSQAESHRTIPSGYSMPYSGGTSYPLSGSYGSHLPTTYPSTTYSSAVSNQSGSTTGHGGSYPDGGHYGTYIPSSTRASAYPDIPSSTRASAYPDIPSSTRASAYPDIPSSTRASAYPVPPQSRDLQRERTPRPTTYMDLNQDTKSESRSLGAHTSPALGAHGSLGPSPVLSGHPASSAIAASPSLGAHGTPNLGPHASSGVHTPSSLSKHATPALGSSITDNRSLPRASPAAVDLLRSERSVLTPSLEAPSFRNLLDLAPPLPSRTPIPVPVPQAPSYRNYVFDPRYYRGQSMESSLSSPLTLPPPPGLVTSQSMTSQLPGTPPGLIPGPPALLNVGAAVTTTVGSYSTPITSHSLVNASRMMPSSTYPPLAPHLGGAAPGIPSTHHYASMYQAGARHAEQYHLAQQSMRHHDQFNYFLQQQKYAMEMEKYARSPAAPYATHSSLSHSSSLGGLGPHVTPSLDMATPKPTDNPYGGLTMATTPEEYYLSMKQRMSFLPRRLNGGPSGPSLAPPTPPTAHGYPYL